MGKDKKQTTTQRLDPASQRYVTGTRHLAGRLTNDIMNAGPLTAELQGTPQEWMSHFMNPYIDQVIGGVGQQYDMARGRAGVMGNQAATGVAGAFGGSRHGIAEGVRMAELDRSQALDVGNLLRSGFESSMTRGMNYAEQLRQIREQQMREPIMRAQAALGIRSAGLGPVGQTTTQVQKGNLVSDIAGIGLMAAGAMTGNPGAVAGGAQVASGGYSGGGPGGFNPPPLFQPYQQGNFSGPNPLSMWR